jgi:toxin ParE1/3/4
VTLDWNEHPEARAEYLDALARYADIEDGDLGEEFADQADAATDLILLWPDAPPPYRGRRREPMVRTWHLGKFPYNLVYAVRDGEIFVLAYAHESRRPGYWLPRLND